MFITGKTGISINLNKVRFFYIEPRPVWLIWSAWASEEVQKVLSPDLGDKCFAVLANTGGGAEGVVCLAVFIYKSEAAEYIDSLTEKAKL